MCDGGSNQDIYTGKRKFARVYEVLRGQHNGIPAAFYINWFFWHASVRGRSEETPGNRQELLLKHYVTIRPTPKHRFLLLLSGNLTGVTFNFTLCHRESCWQSNVTYKLWARVLKKFVTVNFLNKKLFSFFSFFLNKICFKKNQLPPKRLSQKWKLRHFCRSGPPGTRHRG